MQRLKWALQEWKKLNRDGVQLANEHFPIKTVVSSISLSLRIPEVIVVIQVPRAKRIYL